MGARCIACGAELLGVVNRCWKCGRPITEDAVEIPPISRDPIEGLLVRAFDPISGSLLERSSPDPAAGQTGQEAAPEGARSRRLRRGRSTVAAVCAGTAVVLGLFCGVAGFFHGWVLFVAPVGLACGLFGLASPSRRPIAIAGILLCCVGSCAAAFQVAFAVQQTLWPSGIQ